jgi:hypothetical protein
MPQLMSMGGVQPCVPYALSAEMDRDYRIEAAVSDGPQSMGYDSPSPFISLLNLSHTMIFSDR